MAPYTPEQVIAAYAKVLQELAALKGLARIPEEVLPNKGNLYCNLVSISKSKQPQTAIIQKHTICQDVTANKGVEALGC